MTSDHRFEYLDEYVVRDFKDRDIQLGEWSQNNYLSLHNPYEYKKR